jgi:hypothetical protein
MVGSTASSEKKYQMGLDNFVVLESNGILKQ